jgi:predicted nucleotidyltransferase/plasmid maintenance system antidote protein VapI
MNNFGSKIRKLREEKQLPLRIIAAYLNVDQAILSKIERGKRKPPREMVIKLAEYFNVDKKELLTAWLSDKVLYEIADEEQALEALKVAEEQVEYFSFKAIDKKVIIKKMKSYFANDKRIDKAWLFGSFVRNEDNYKSDIDLMIRFNEKAKISLFDLADIQYHLEELTGRKIDLGEEGMLKPFAWETAKNDLISIYEK